MRYYYHRFLSFITAFSLIFQQLSPAFAMIREDDNPLPLEEIKSSSRVSPFLRNNDSAAIITDLPGSPVDHNNKPSRSHLRAPMISFILKDESLEHSSADLLQEHKRIVLPAPLREELEEINRLLLSGTQARKDKVETLVKDIRTLLMQADQGFINSVKRDCPELLKLPDMRPHIFVREGLKERLLSEQTLSHQHPFFGKINSLIDQFDTLVKDPRISLSLATLLRKLSAEYMAYVDMLCTVNGRERLLLLSYSPLWSEGLEGHYGIAKETAYDMLSIDEYGLTHKANKTGSTAVAALGGLHFKKNLLTIKGEDPTLVREGTLDPAMEWAMYAFSKLLVGGGMSPSALIVISDLPCKEPLPGTRAQKLVQAALNPNLGTTSRQDLMDELHYGTPASQFTGETRSHIAQISKTIQGELLGDYLKRAETDPSLLKALDRKSFSQLVLTSLLINPADYKGDNLMVTAQGVIVGIDNDRALANMIVALSEDRHYSEARNILFCLPELMQEPLHEEVKETFLKHSPHAFLLNWLRILQEQNDRYQDLTVSRILDIEMYKLLHLPLRFAPGAVKEIGNRFIMLQELLKAQPYLTHQSLFASLYPLASLYYTRIVQKEKNSLGAFKRIYEQTAALEDILGPRERLSDGQTVDKALRCETKEKGAYKARTQTLIQSAQELLDMIDLEILSSPAKAAIYEAASQAFPVLSHLLMRFL